MVPSQSPPLASLLSILGIQRKCPVVASFIFGDFCLINPFKKKKNLKASTCPTIPFSGQNKLKWP
jgi:hypothetical protein